MHVTMMILLLLQKLASCCKSSVKEKIINVQTNQALKSDISELLENHAANSALMIVIGVVLALVSAACCYGCVKHNVTTIRRSIANENARVMYTTNPEKETKFRIPA
jgi:hypothetical protein